MTTNIGPSKVVQFTEEVMVISTAVLDPSITGSTARARDGIIVRFSSSKDLLKLFSNFTVFPSLFEIFFGYICTLHDLEKNLTDTVQMAFIVLPSSAATDCE